MLVDSSAAKPACCQQSSSRLARSVTWPSSSAEGDAGRPAGVHDHPRLADSGEDVGGAAHHMAFPDRLGQLLLVVDAVLQRHHGGVVPQQRAQPGRGRVGVKRLDAEQHEITRADLGRVVGGLDLHGEVAFDAPHPQASLAEGLQVHSARDEVDFRSGLGEPAAEIAADSPGAVDSHPHCSALLRPRS
jgi:hypothetical protein